MDVSLFVTGSNSTLLSGELSTLLTGRTVEFEILPFSFYEMKLYYELNKMEWNEDMFFDYLKWGGFPLRFDYHDESSIRKYISNLYESIVNRDIIGKSRSADKKSFMDISLYILANAGKELSIDNVIEAYKKSNKEIAKRTIYNYLERMKKAYLIHGVGRYNIVGKAALSNREKQYAVDVGFRTINTNTLNYEDTFYLENIVKFVFLKDISRTMIPSHYFEKIKKYNEQHAFICLKLSNVVMQMNKELKTTQYQLETAMTYLCVPVAPKK